MKGNPTPPIRSAIYRGHVRHRRFTPKTREFRHLVCYFYLDLAEIPSRFALRFFFSDRAPSLFGFRRSAYLGPSDLSLDEAVRRKVQADSGVRPMGPIRALTQISYFGLTFNPVTFYYCFDEKDECVTNILTEITNTPWGERHTYVLSAGDTQIFEFEKRFHVSPFLGMDFKYRWGFSPPSERLNVHMENHSIGAMGKPTFDSTLTLERTDWSPLHVTIALFQQPFMSLKTITLIYFHAAMIWLRRIPFVAHPKSLGEVHPRGAPVAIHSISKGTL